jgi:hypothetical protein
MTSALTPGCCASCGQRLPYASWRAELLDRAPAIVARGGPGSDWWRRKFVAEFGREPVVELRIIDGGRA